MVALSLRLRNNKCLEHDTILQLKEKKEWNKCIKTKVAIFNITFVLIFILNNCFPFLILNVWKMRKIYLKEDKGYNIKKIKGLLWFKENRHRENLLLFQVFRKNCNVVASTM